VVAGWAVCLVAGILAATQLPARLTNSFDVPGTGSARAAAILAERFDERPEGTFIVVFPVRHSSDAALRTRLEERLARAARVVPTGHSLGMGAGGGLFWGEVATRLSFQDAKRRTDTLRRALGPGAVVTGQPAI
jgi:hypothetical protein